MKIVYASVLLISFRNTIENQAKINASAEQLQRLLLKGPKKSRETPAQLDAKIEYVFFNLALFLSL